MAEEELIQTYRPALEARLQQVVNRLDDEVVRTVNRMVNRITLGMMASGLFVGSSLLLAFGGEPVLGVPSIRWLATGMLWGSAVTALYVVWRVIRSNRA